MADLIDDDDRRRSPRFICGGDARISRLPSDGTLVFGKLRNLSVGGICVDTNHPVDLGARTELLIRANAVPFRTVGLVRAISGSSRACLEFVQMSAGGKGMLAEVLEQMAKVQRVLRKLRSARVGTTAELSRELEGAGVRTALAEGVLLLGRARVDQSSEPNSERGAERIVELTPLVIKVDLFG